MPGHAALLSESIPGVMGRVGASDKVYYKALLLSHKMKEGHPSFLNSSSERSLGAAGSNLASDFVNGICLKDYTGVIEPLYNFVPQD